MILKTINPATGCELKSYSMMSDAVVKEVIADSHYSYCDWRHTTFDQRRQLMTSLSACLNHYLIPCAELIVSEMGKTFLLAKAEVKKCAWLCQYYAEHAEPYLNDQGVSSDNVQASVAYQSQGIVFGIMPWNFPFWQVFRYMVPNLMAGNVVLLKHAPITTGSALLIEQLMQYAGFPNDVFRVLLIETTQVNQVISDSRVIGVTLTGSERAGRAVAAQAGAALKPCVLELGGNDPCIILEDADIAQAAEIFVKARMNVSGQVCISPKRLIAVSSIYREFKHHVMKQLQRYQFGDPMLATTDLGPLARADLRDQLQRQVDRSLEEGAQLLMGGYIPSGEGFYYPPTALERVQPGSIVFDEELFGPVVSLIEVKDEQQAIAWANDSRFGLSATVFTQDVKRGERIARSLDVGCCGINRAVSSDPGVPFGGIKNSGFGRELGQAGIMSFVNQKSILVG